MRPVLRPLLAPLVLAAPAASQTLDWTSFERLRDAILPRADEERWLAIGWRASFLDAVREAQAERKPLLLWAMNGHPLGCT